MPYNKWQTHVFVGEDQVEASLVQATNSNNEKLYVNQYGQIKPYPDVKDELTTAKTQLFSLDELTDKRVSVPAGITGASVLTSTIYGTNGIDFGASFAAAAATETSQAQLDVNLSQVLKVSVDGSDFVNIDLNYLKTQGKTLTGPQLAAEITNNLNNTLGDQSNFDFTDLSNRSFVITSSKVVANGAQTPTPVTINIFDTAAPADLKNKTIKETVAEIQAKLDASAINTDLSLTPPVAFATQMKVSYDYDTQSFKFEDGASTISIKSLATKNDAFGLTSNPITLLNGLYGGKAIPNGASLLDPKNQRYGMKVTFDSVNKTFNIVSGTTGDKSSLIVLPGITGINKVLTSKEITDLPDDDEAKYNAALALAKNIFGFEAKSISSSDLALRGIESTPAIA